MRRPPGGGMTYDALLVRCALKAQVEVIYTWNVRHFRLFGTEVRLRVRTP
jgi:predicted nucleic acid-binding protein